MASLSHSVTEEQVMPAFQEQANLLLYSPFSHISTQLGGHLLCKYAARYYTIEDATVSLGNTICETTSVSTVYC